MASLIIPDSLFVFDSEIQPCARAQIMFLGPEIFEASDGITRTDSTAELCALEVLKSCDDDEVAPERTVLWEDTLLSTEPEPEVTLSHEILRQFMEMKNEFDEGPGVSNAIIAADDYECGLLEIENENGFSEDLTIKGDIPSIHPSFGDSSSTLDQASRSFSYDLLHSLPSISTSDQSIRRNQSFGAVPVLPLVDRRALLNNAIPCFPLGPQTPASLFPNVNQIRRVTSQPVFPSFLNPNPSQSVLNPKTPHTMPRNVSSGILHNSESGLTWISKPSSSMPGCVQPQLQQFLASSGGFFQPLPEHSELPHTTSRPPSIKSILGGYIGDGHIYQVLFKRGIRNFVLAPSLVKKGVKVGDYVKVEADRGEDLGKVISRLR